MKMFVCFQFLLCFMLVNYVTILQAKKADFFYEGDFSGISGDGPELDDETGGEEEDKNEDVLPQTKNCHTMTTLIIVLIAALSVTGGVVIILILVIIYLGHKVDRLTKKGVYHGTVSPASYHNNEYEDLRWRNEMTVKSEKNISMNI